MANGGSAFRSIYTVVGGILSFFYIGIGILFLKGEITFDIQPLYLNLFGVVLILYGLFRVYTFYQRYKNMRNEE
jgi:predicted membrane chloride channel (bestrophin family)